MANGVIVPNNYQAVKSLAINAKLYCNGNTRILQLNGFSFDNASYAAFIPEEDRGTGVHSVTLFAKSSPTSYKMGWLNITAEGALNGYYVENELYVVATGYKAFGEIVWSV